MNLLQKLLLNTEKNIRGFRRRLRSIYYSNILKSMGKDCQICDHVLIYGHENISLGKHVHVNEGVILQSCVGSSITIGDCVILSYGAYVLTGGIQLAPDIIWDKHLSSPVTIEDYAWIGARSIILPGVTIGKGAVVAAGSVVTQNVKPGSLIAGVPAKVKKH
ncbi:MAG: acyltransferase [Desulfobacteraceae bacterium]|nr:acyltransferase [Desulfobacteraceae bacterium]